MEKFKIYLDDIYFPDVEGWKDAVKELRRPESIKAFLNELVAEFKFSGDAFQYLLDKKREDACQSVSIRVEFSCGLTGNFEELSPAIILLSQVEFNLTKCTAKVSVVDNHITSKIFNNSSLKVIPTAGKSKNGVDIDVVVPYDTDMHIPCSGDPLDDQSFTFRVFDILKYVIDFVSDGTVGFRSALFDIGGDWEGLMISTGAHLKKLDEARIEYTFDDAFIEVDKKINIGFKVDVSGPIPVIEIGRFGELFTNNISLLINNVYEIIEKTDQTKNYSAVKFGSGATLESRLCPYNEPAFPDEIDFIGCKDEEYIILGNCNINKVLDLKGNWIVSSNVIEDIILPPNNTDYDDQIIFVHCENIDPDTHTCSSVQTDIFGTVLPVFYNAALFNNKVADNHLGAIPNSIVQYFGPTTNIFKAVYTQGYAVGVNNGTVSTPNSPVWFHDDYTAPANDVNNNYGNGTAQGSPVSKANSRFTAPLNSSYQFRVFVGEYYTPPPVLIRVFVAVHDASNVLKYKYFEDFSTTGVPGSLEMITPFMYMASTDYAIVEIQGGVYVNYDQPLEFELISILNTGGPIKEYDPKDYLNNVISAKTPISYSNWKLIEANATDKITLNDGENEVSGHILSAKYKIHSAMADLTLITTNG